MIRRVALSLLVSSASLGCGEDAPAPAPAVEEAPAPVAEPAPEAPPADPNEACARVVVVAWQGATAAPAEITRSKDEARERANQLLARVDGGESFVTVASAESDAPSSRARGGAIGTFVRDEWPELFAPLKDAIFQVGVGQRTPVVEAPFGWVFGERCAVEKVHTRHLLIRYTGARNAPEDLERSQEAARTLASELRQAAVDGRDFEELAREHSEDGSAERGGDLGSVGRGLFQPPFEEAAFATPVGGFSDVVETVYGYHVIQRVE
ncbi:MAG: peptidylprolyl isomerase [Sandaracinus sp.]|nr:peptidylprolyl isomerase [Sandaracinus sp.]MCB9625514.1 peptidylprolyl isomerase [Sandaracinus sp.]